MFVYTVFCRNLNQTPFFHRVCELLEGKGAGKGNKFQAKVARMANRIKAEQLIAEYFSE